MKKIILFISCCFLLSNANAARIENNIQIEFQLFSCTLTDASKKILDDNAEIIMQKIKSEQCAVVISSNTCKKELKKNQNIGLIRSRVIMDYLEKKHNISRSNFFIIDEHFDGIEDSKCTNTRFIKFRFICD